MLPPLLADESCTNADGSTTEAQRQWVRHLALTTIIQQTAVNKLARTSSSSTFSDHEAVVGQLVDYLRPPSSTDASGWNGPVKVVKVSPEDGQVICRIGRRDFLCRIRDIRPAAMLAMLNYVSSFGRPSPAWIEVQDFLWSSTPGAVLHLGIAYDSGEVICTTFTPKQQRLLSALMWVAQSELNISHPIASRLGRGVPRFDAARRAAESSIVCWPAGRLDHYLCYTSSPAKVSMSILITPPV